MKVVLFCGGQGTRLREHSDSLPKPLICIGGRPILWHLMRYYAHYGHTEFVLCLGYRGDLIRDYFLNYEECMSNDFTLSGDGGRVLHGSDVHDWSIRCLDTGLHSSIGQRLLLAREYVADEPIFLANYADGLSDLPLDRLIDEFASSRALVSFAAVPAPRTLTAVSADARGYVEAIGPPGDAHALINGGFFALRPGVFDFMREGEELLEQPFARLVAQGRLMSYRHAGFWQSLDTYADKVRFERMTARGECPWAVWRT
ncbi:MAG TPA: sugar phosphate nucleotidyltransferase [Steroidobacteraceae bacterium]|nr:sugar phosphate nucleotidyltransferase [Steroidobacteraceae bacterium]